MYLGRFNHHNEKRKAELISRWVLIGHCQHQRMIINLAWESSLDAWLLYLGPRGRGSKDLHCLWLLWISWLGLRKRDRTEKSSPKPF
jgi:hypothetical protein